MSGDHNMNQKPPVKSYCGGKPNYCEPTELELCVKEFFEKYLNRVEESDEGREFSPIELTCCRAAMLEPLNNLLDKMAKLSGAKAKVTYTLE